MQICVHIYGHWPLSYFIFHDVSFKHRTNVRHWNLSFLEGRRLDATRDEPGHDWLGLRKPRRWPKRILTSFPGVPHRNFFLQSGYSEQANQRDTRQTITKQRRCLSDGPNVTDLRAAVCEGQAWHAAEQRGPRADAQSRLGNWLVAPLLSRHSLHETLASLVSGSGGSWPTFTPLFLSVSIKTYEFVYFPSYISEWWGHLS